MTDRPEIGLMTVRRVELEAARNLLDVQGPGTLDGDFRYWRATIDSDRLRRPLAVVLTVIGEVGNKIATSATRALIGTYGPRSLFLVGIGGGLRGKVQLGDVVASRVVYDYEGARLEHGGPLPRHRTLLPPWQVRQDLELFDVQATQWTALLHRLVDARGSCQSRSHGALQADSLPQPELSPTPHVAAIASGEKLAADGRLLQDLRRRHHEAIRAVDMEAAGFATACTDTAAPVPWLVIRGVSDYADDQKSDTFQYAAACVAMAYFAAFVAEGLSEETLASGQPDRGIHRPPASPKQLREAIEGSLARGDRTAAALGLEHGISEKMAENVLHALLREGVAELRGVRYGLRHARHLPGETRNDEGCPQ